MNDLAANLSILGPALIAGVLVTLSHVPMGQQVLARGIVFIDLAIAQVAGLGVIAAHNFGLGAESNWSTQVSAAVAALLGALQAVNQFGLKIPMAGVDGLPEALAAIKKGDLAATVFQDPEGQGGGGVWGCYLAVKGVNLPKDLLIPFTLVTPDNVDNFVAIANRVYVK